MKASTQSYIHLQKLYKDQFLADKAVLKSFIPASAGEIPEDLIDTFIKNAHGVQVVVGEQYGAFDRDAERVVNAFGVDPKNVAIHFALRAVREELEANLGATVTEEARIRKMVLDVDEV